MISQVLPPLMYIVLLFNCAGAVIILKEVYKFFNILLFENMMSRYVIPMSFARVINFIINALQIEFYCYFN